MTDDGKPNMRGDKVMLHLLKAARSCVVEQTADELNKNLSSLREECLTQMDEHEGGAYISETNTANHTIELVGSYSGKYGFAGEGQGIKVVVEVDKVSGCKTVIGFIVAERADKTVDSKADIQYFAWMGHCYCGVYDNEQYALTNVIVAAYG